MDCIDVHDGSSERSLLLASGKLAPRLHSLIAETTENRGSVARTASMRAASAAADCSATVDLPTTPAPFCLSTEGGSGFLDRCALGVDELPAPLLPNEHTGPATLLIDHSLLVLSFGGGSIGHDGGIPIAADFNVIDNERLEFHPAGLAVLQVLRAVLDGAAWAEMGVVFVQDALEESDIRLDKGRIQVLDELRQLALVTGRVGKGTAVECEQEDRDREKMLHRPTFQSVARPDWTLKSASAKRRVSDCPRAAVGCSALVSHTSILSQ